MKRFTATFLILFLGCQAALAGIGSIRFCISTVDAFRVRLECVKGQTDPCCRYESEDPLDVARHLADCEDCQEGQLGGQDSDQVTSPAERALLKAPSTAFAPFTGLESPQAPRNLFALAPASSRGPPVLQAAAVQQYSSTVAFRL